MAGLQEYLDRLHLGPGGPPAPTPPVPALAWINVQDYGAIGDGVTDDSGAIALAYAAIVAAGGGTVVFPGPNTYRTTTRLNVTTSHVTIEGNGATLLFDPSDPVTHDRALAIHGLSLGGRAITGAIAKGATSFVATLAGSVSDLVANDWLTVTEVGDVAGDPYFVDWVQVASVAGTTVNVQTPFRMAFPGTHATVQFARISSLVTDVVVRDLIVRSTHTAAPTTVGLTVGAATRRTTIERCVFDFRNGGGLSTYLAADVTVTTCRISSRGGTPEWAATVDLVVSGNTFGTFDAPVASAYPAAQLDFGTAFFVFAGNRLVNAGNIGLELLGGVHDGVVSGNVLGWVTDIGIGTGAGILGSGLQHVTIVGNVLDGGSTASVNTGIALTADTTATPTIPSVGNYVVGNVVTNFALPFGTVAAGDVYLQPSATGAAGTITIPNGLERAAVGPGTAALPSLGFVADPTTGFYSPTGGYLGFATGGTFGWAMNNAALYLQATFGINWTTTTPFGTVDLRIRRGAAKTLTVDDGAAGAAALAVVGAFGANGAAPQTPVVSGGALAAFAAGANGMDTNAHMLALYNLVVAMRATLVSNGLMS